jgi:hypothetical protein
MLGSIHEPHPSPHRLPVSVVVCSTHPGHAHSTPHVHPEPASKDISLMDGMEGKSGIEGGKDEDGDIRMGARSGPGVRVKLFMRFFCRLRKAMLAGVADREW